MLDVLLVPIGVQLLLPVSLLMWLAFRRHPNTAAWALAVVFVACVIALLACAGLWLLLPWYMPRIYGALLIPAAAISFMKGVPLRPRWPHGAGGWAGASLRGVLAAFAASTALYAISGRRAPAATMDVAFPLRQGTYLVVNGGSIELLNAHLMTLVGERFRAYRGQSYGVDIVRIDAWGRRATGLQPRDPADYRIFGDSVFAPCAGRVVEVLDGLRDQPVPVVDRAHMAGNHVLLACGTFEILLGHLQQGSVRVGIGSTVGTETLLGRVGNTGNTGEPHLHIHAQRIGTTAMPLGGEPLPIRLNGRYPVRNLRFTERR
jgi:Peptidase family M23